MCVNHELSGILSTDRTLPCSISGCGHERDEGPQVEALPMHAFIPSDWSLDDVPCEWIVEIDDDLVDFDVIVGSLHQSLDIIGRLLNFLLIYDLLIELVDSEPFHEVYGKSEGEVIFYFSMGNLLLGECSDF